MHGRLSSFVMRSCALSLAAQQASSPACLKPHPCHPPCHAAGVRLVSNSLTSDNAFILQGRLEVKGSDNKWSSVCDDGFSDAAAGVVCRQVSGEVQICLLGGWVQHAARQTCCLALLPCCLLFAALLDATGPAAATTFAPQLGLSRTGFALPFAAFGEGSGPILYDNVACTGSEAIIQQCPRALPKDVDCESLSFPLLLPVLCAHALLGPHRHVSLLWGMYGTTKEGPSCTHMQAAWQGMHHAMMAPSAPLPHPTPPSSACHAGTHREDVGIVCSNADPRVLPSGASSRQLAPSHGCVPYVFSFAVHTHCQPPTV